MRRFLNRFGLELMLLAAAVVVALGLATLVCPPVFAATVQLQAYSVSACPSTVTPAAQQGWIPVAVDPHGNVCTISSGGGGGGAVTITSGNLTAATPATTAALGSSQVVKASAGTLYSFNVSADPTLAAAPWWVLIFNATAAPSNGAVTPAKCYAEPAGATSASGAFAAGGVAFSTGITIVASSTGCFTQTLSAHAFISGDGQ